MCWVLMRYYAACHAVHCAVLACCWFWHGQWQAPSAGVQNVGHDSCGRMHLGNVWCALCAVCSVAAG